jgi:hypothetical protein
MKMLNRYRVHIAAYVVMILLATVATASAQNLFVNPSFESGPTGGAPQSWLAFGNMAVERLNAPQFVPYDGTKLLSMWGNWSGPYNVTGIYQEFASNPADQWALCVVSRHYSGDALTGSRDEGGNFVVQKIVFKNASDEEIGSVESLILDGTFATDTWFVNQPITGIAPIGTVQVEAMILYVQAADAGGAAHIDYCSFIYCGAVGVEESSWGAIKSLYE